MRGLGAIGVVLAGSVAAGGCGLGWIEGEDDRTAGLPTAGAGPYARIPGDDLTPVLEPVYLSDRGADLSDPSILARDGGGFRIWFTASEDPMLAEIQLVEGASVREEPDVAPMRVLGADAAWEANRVASPSVLVDPATGELVLYYEAGPTTAPAIGRARSADGVTWQKDAGPVLADAAAPSAVIVDGATWLFVVRPGVAGIWRAVDTGAGGSFALDAAPVVMPRPGLEDAFDRLEVSAPFALAVPTLADGVTRVHLWFAGATDLPQPQTAIGYAASFDGVTWLRFGGAKPMLVSEATGPTVLLEASRGTMLFAQEYRGRLALTAAEHP